MAGTASEYAERCAAVIATAYSGGIDNGIKIVSDNKDCIWLHVLIGIYMIIILFTVVLYVCKTRVYEYNNINIACMLRMHLHVFIRYFYRYETAKKHYI